jgi:hypothetical protein
VTCFRVNTKGLVFRPIGLLCAVKIGFDLMLGSTKDNMLKE